MTESTPGVVLARRSLGEYDRLASVYTRAFGRMTLRFIGVDRPRGKLRALSEPMTHADYRLYVRAGSSAATVTGGCLLDSHPDIRRDLERTLAGLEMCEMLLRLTPEASPSGDKFDLIVGHLGALDAAPTPWLGVSFGLRLLALAGFGPELAGIVPEDRELRLRLLGAAPERLREIPEQAGSLERLTSLIGHAVEVQIERSLNTRDVRRSLCAA